MSTFLEERIYYPSGVNFSDEVQMWNVVPWRVFVIHVKAGQYMVSLGGREGHRQLSQTGRWLFMPKRMHAERWCRFDFATACSLAEDVIDEARVGGLTWGQAWAARLDHNLKEHA